jgi:hypothetical protein
MSDLCRNAFHVAPDTRDLLEADLVDLRRRELRGRVRAREVGVPDVARGELTPADAVARVRQVFGFEVIVQAPIGGQHLLAQGTCVRVNQAPALVDRESRRKTQDRTPEDTLSRILDADLLELWQRRLDDCLGQYCPLVDSELEVRDGLVDPCDEPVHA